MKNREDVEKSNRSDNRPFSSVLTSYSSRRRVLRGSLELAAAVFFASSPAMAEPKGKARGRSKLIDFEPVPVEGGGGAMPRIAEDYEMQFIIPWGDPINPSSGPAFDWPPSAADQALQIGKGHDGMWYFPLDKSGNRGLLALNHEYGFRIDFTGDFSNPFRAESLDEVRVSQHAHGVSILELASVNGQWQHVDSGYSRRIHVNTPVEFSGPAAHSPRLQNPAGNPPAGTLNNCSNGHTPWGTYLTCEENVHFYFGDPGGTFVPDEFQQRYGFPFDFHGWAAFDPRFDLGNADYANECNRFGWVVEIDPTDPTAPPVKRTALGRFRHEGCAVTVGRGGRAVGYMGDDENGEYLYKFVSDKNWEALRAQGLSPLDHGKLYAARFDDDGTGEWLLLSLENPLLAAEFNDEADVLMFARKAADIVGATPLGRPEWTAVGPDEQVYATLTAGHDGEGSILRWRDSDHHVGTRFEWDVFVIASDTFDTEATFNEPDGLWADPDGRVFIQTDGRGQPSGLNDQMLVADSATGEIRRLFEGVPGCEVSGITVTPDRRTMFINVQHPGEFTGGTTFPHDPSEGIPVPRDATVVIRRKDGGIVGS
ncbi:MAG: PhoX family phosphatase [Gammaproteobacteria bacterium]|nr:PhoX family phosphatase [Gammaproteobacteria bacterium]